MKASMDDKIDKMMSIKPSFLALDLRCMKHNSLVRSASSCNESRSAFIWINYASRKDEMMILISRVMPPIFGIGNDHLILMIVNNRQTFDYFFLMEFFKFYFEKNSVVMAPSWKKSSESCPLLDQSLPCCLLGNILLLRDYLVNLTSYQPSFSSFQLFHKSHY